MEGSKLGRIGVLHNMKSPGTAASPTYSVLVRLVLSVANSPRWLAISCKRFLDRDELTFEEMLACKLLCACGVRWPPVLCSSGSRVVPLCLDEGLDKARLLAGCWFSKDDTTWIQTDSKDSRRAKVVPFLQKVLALEQLEEANVQEVLGLAKEVGLKKSYLENALLDPDQQKILHDQLIEVSLWTYRMTTHDSHDMGRISHHSVSERSARHRENEGMTFVMWQDRLFVSQVIGLKPGAAAVITNGRVRAI